MVDSPDIVANPDTKVLHDAALSELSSLGRVSHRLAMTDDGAPLEKVLSLLLPRLLSRIGSNHKRTADLAVGGDCASSPVAELKRTYDKIHSKLVEMLSHTMKRTRADANCHIPCEAILALLFDKETMKAHAATDVDPFTLNLSLAFLTLGLPRCTASEVEALLPGFLALVGVNSGIASLQMPSSKNQAHQCAHLVLRAIEAIVSSGKSLSARREAKDSANDSRAKVAEKNAESHLGNIWQVCGDAKTGPAVYDLLLDALVYQPTTGGGSRGSDLPSPGMSQSGFERLLSGASLTAKDWAAEHAAQSRLRDLKLCLLDFVAPCRKWALFEGKTDARNLHLHLGTARTVALLAVASGDPHPDVSERAASYLKAHMDSMRSVITDGQKSVSSALLGHPQILLCAFLTLVLGDNVADSTAGINEQSPSYEHLGMFVSPPDGTESDAVRTVLLSTKRRMLLGETSATVLSFASGRILDDIPSIFTMQPSTENPVGAASVIGKFVLAVCNYYLVGATESAGTRKRPQVAASRLLCSFCIRLASLYDRISESVGFGEGISTLHNLLARALAIACSVLSASSSSHTVQGKSGSVEVKDACYGVICSVARSEFATAKGGVIFNCGGQTAVQMASPEITEEVHSIATAALLFACASNEEESLRLRSVAALDALLAAYCRVFESMKKSTKSEATSSCENPWQQSAGVSEESDGVSHSADGQLGFQSLSKSLLPLLWSGAKSSQPKASRLASARWGSQLMKSLDLVNACHLLCFLAGDSDVTTASIARDGLGIIGSDAFDEEEEFMTAPLASTGKGIPPFCDLINAIFSNGSEGRGSSWKPTYHDFSPRGQCAALRFGVTCLLNDLYGDDKPVKEFVSAIADSLLELGGGRSSKSKELIDLLDECAVCLRLSLATSQSAREWVVKESSELTYTFLGQLALTAASSTARRHFAAASGYLYEDSSLWFPKGTSCEVGEWAELSGVSETLSLCGNKLNEMQTNLFMVGEVHGAAFLGASCIRSLRLASAHSSGSDTNMKLWAIAASIIIALGRGTSHSDDSIGNACSRGLAISMSYDSADAPILEEFLYPAVSSALDELRASLRKYGNGDHTDATRATFLARAAGKTLAASTSASGHAGNQSGGTIALGHVRLQCVDALFTLLGSAAFRKDPAISIVAGEALAAYADAAPEGAVWTPPSKLRPSTFDDKYANELPPHEHAIYVLLEREMKATSPHKRNACAPAMLALVGRAAKMVNDNNACQSRAFVQECLKNVMSFQTAFISLLADPKCKQLGRESCCLGLAACRGLTIATESSDGETVRGARELNERLLRAFGQTTNFGGSAMMETRRQNAERLQQENRNGEGPGSAAAIMEEFGEETEVGGASGVGEAALGAYREMAAAAMSLSRPDVLYSLMLLSVTNPVWFGSGLRERYNAASLLGQAGAGGVNTAEIRQALRPHLQRLIPRLLRACNDPNKQTREQMTGLWVSLTGGGAESRSLVSEHLHYVLDSLIDDATNKLWRARVGACGALSEVIVGRTWEELGGGGAVMDDSDMTIDGGSSAGVRLLRLWRVTTRALDDVRLHVRESGQLLARSVRSLTIRLCDPSARNDESTSQIVSVSPEEIEATAAAAAATALRWLVKFGLQAPCAEAVGVCVSCLLGIVDVARPLTLQPVLPELIGSLSMAMSGLEPAALNYLQVRAAGQDGTTGSVNGYDELERVRLQLASSGPIAGALTKCLDMLRFVPVEAQKDVIPFIDTALRCGAGFATRAAAADAVSTLCSTCPSAFKFPGHSNANPTVRLLRALYFASERERGSAAKDKMAHALGSLAALSPGHSVRVLAVRACERYSNATGSNDDPSARRAAAAALRAIAVRASTQFADGGSNNVWCQKVLPLAYLGRKDNDRKVASLWKDVWEEGGTVANVGGTNAIDSGILLEEKLLPFLVQECVTSLNDVSWARREVACAALAELAEMEVLAPCPRPVNPKPDLKPSSDLRLRSRRRAQAANHALANCARILVKSRVWTGKAELVKATVFVAGKWVMLGTAEGCKDQNNWGWERQENSSDGASCPWIPVVQSLVWDDLFASDGWFVEEHDIVEEDADSKNDGDGEQEEVDESELGDDSALDLCESDKDLDSANPSNTDDVCSTASLPDVSVTFSGLCRALLDQSFPASAKLASWGRDDILPYRSAALQGLSRLLKSVSSSDMSASKEQTKFMYRHVAPRLMDAIQCSGSSPNEEEPPLIVARSVECLSVCMWHGMGGDNFVEVEDIAKLAKLFCHSCGPKQPAWTVREASALAGASLASRAALSPLIKHGTISTLLECSTQTAKDRKFWRVRCAGLRLLHALVLRVGFSSEQSISRKTDPHRQLLLEAILPHKEKILKLAKSSLTDNEAKVTAVATEICSTVSWWP